MGGPGGGAASGRRFPNVRSQIYFLDPDGMKIGWQTAGGGVERVYLPGQLTVPARYNFMQGYIYRLKLNDIPGRPGVQLYPTLEVAPSTPATDAYLTHNPIPVQFTAEDFDQVVDGGNFVTKVIYLPDPRFQELAIAGVETLVSTRLEPGVDPILEADKRGTILLIVRLGAIDLEMHGRRDERPERGEHAGLGARLGPPGAGLAAAGLAAAGLAAAGRDDVADARERAGRQRPGDPRAAEPRTRRCLPPDAPAPPCRRRHPRTRRAGRAGRPGS